MSFQTAGKPVFPTDDNKIYWYNHQAGYVIETCYDPSNATFSTTAQPYNIPSFLEQRISIPNGEGLNIVGGNGRYDGNDNSIRSYNQNIKKDC